MKWTTTKTAYLGFCFCLLFSAYVTAQSFLTSLYGDTGFVSFTAIYIPYALTSLISPFIGRLIGVKITLLTGAFSYVLWTIAVASGDRPFLLVASIFNGVGCGLLWVHQGVYLNRLIEVSIHHKVSGSIATGSLPVTQNTGFLTGVFFSIYSANLCFGSLVALILSTHFTIFRVIWWLTLLAGLAWICICFLPTPDHASWIVLWNFLAPVVHHDRERDTPLGIARAHIVLSNAVIEKNEEMLDQYSNVPTANSTPVAQTGLKMGLNTSDTLREHFVSLYEALCLSGFSLLIPLHILLALTVVFSFGRLPLFLGDSFPIIALLFIVYGTVSVIMSRVWGRVCDRFGSLVTFTVAVCLIMLQFCSLLIWSHGMLFIRATGAAMIDSALITIVYTSISKNYDSRHSPFLFALYRFFYCATFALISWLNIFISYSVFAIIILSWTSVTSVALISHSLCYAKQSAREQMHVSETNNERSVSVTNEEQV